MAKKMTTRGGQKKMMTRGGREDKKMMKTRRGEEEREERRRGKAQSLQPPSQAPRTQLSAPAMATLWPPAMGLLLVGQDRGLLCWARPHQSPGKGALAPWGHGRCLAGASSGRCHHQQQLRCVPGCGWAACWGLLPILPWPPPRAAHGQASSSSPSRSRGAQAGSRKEERTLCRAPQGLVPPEGAWGAAP